MILQRRVVYRRRQDGFLRVYRAGIDVTETVPAGAGNVAISAYGGGGSGGLNLIGGGGGGGAYAYKSIAVSPGNTFIYTVGVGGLAKLNTPSGNGNNGTSSIVTGNVSGGSVNLVAGGGETTRGDGSSGYPGYGGIATGGDTNNPGANAHSQLGGGGAGPRGGAGGIWYAHIGEYANLTSFPTEFGGGGHGQFYFFATDLGRYVGPYLSAHGKHGAVMFEYSP
jgi:hypothetical protein